MAGRKNSAVLEPHPYKSVTPFWTFYRVEWTFLTRLCASVPADSEIIDKWLASRQPKVRPAGGKSIEAINEEVLASLATGGGEPDQDYSMLVFQRHGGRIVMRYSTVRAHIKDCARQISTLFVGKIEGEKSFNVRVINGVYLDEREYWLPVLKDAQPVTEADGAYDKPIHVMTRQGQMNALKRFEFIDPPSTLSFTLKVLGKSVSESDLHHLFQYGGTHGYAGERGDGEGRYEYAIRQIGAAV